MGQKILKEIYTLNLVSEKRCERQASHQGNNSWKRWKLYCSNMETGPRARMISHSYSVDKAIKSSCSL